MAIDFPTSPTVGQQYSFNGVTYTFTAQGVWASSGPTVPATPFDALAYNGMQFNGGMEVDQEQTGAVNMTGVAALRYTVDGWQVGNYGAQNIQSLHYVGATPVGNNALRIYVNTANPSPAVDNWCMFMHSIEGYRTSRLLWGTAAAMPITMSFWINSNVTGMFSGSIGNKANNRGYAFTFTINVANAWEYKTITVPGDTTGVWETGSIQGLIIAIVFMAGSAAQGTPGVWSSTPSLAATGTTNGVATAGNAMLLTGFTVFPGTVAPSAAQSPLIMRPYDQELMTCQRHFNIVSPIAGLGYSDTFWGHELLWPTTMRAAPTATVTSILYNVNCSGASIDSLTAAGARFYVAITAPGHFDFNGGVVKADARI